MELRSRTTKTSTPVDEGDEDRKEDESDSVSDDDDEFYEVLSSETDDDSDFSDGDDSNNGKINSLKRKERPKNYIEVEINDHVDDIPGPSKKTRKIKGTNKKKEKPILMWNIWEEEHEKWLDENEDKDFDLEKQDEVMIESAEAPSDMNVELLRYQKEWLAWALKQESSPIKGGILADEMGMGKTIQAIALVLAKRELSREACASSSQPSSSRSTRITGTLVICPVVAVSQWVGEIDRFTLKGSTKVLVYHGPNRERYSKQFSEYDFVITTYSIVESEYRKYVMPPRQKCPNCGRLLVEKKMRIHLRYYCGLKANKTEKQAKQMKKRKYVIDPPKEKNLKKKKKNKKDDYEPEKSEKLHPKGKSALFSAKWERIILDEAHYVKDRHSNTAKGVLSLESSYKWALSGTPIQNRVGELYSLIRFLHIVPHSFYLCKDCDCRAPDHSASTQCSQCPHKSVRHFCWWNKYIATPIQLYSSEDRGRRAMILLKHKILKMSVLRRTKKGRAADLALPPRIILLRNDTLDVREHDYYESLYTDSRAEFNTYVEAGTLLNNYAHIFDLLTRLRQAVDHPYLVVYSASAALRNKRNYDIGEKICGICHETAEDHVVTACEHVFCKACLIDYSSSFGQVSCPTCSKLLTVDLTSKAETSNQTSKISIKGFKSSSILNRIPLVDFKTSTKIEALREEIRNMAERDGSAKGIVFSQFTSFLDIISYSLQKSGVKCVQLVGSMTMNAREAAIKTFIEDADCKIFLMSLKAGGVALNLTVASHVFLMDPWWNPAVERQAQDRIHRIGQYKPIRIVRFVIENTIEDKILRLQQKKELVFEGTVGGSSEALMKLTEEDMRFLFT